MPLRPSTPPSHVLRNAIITAAVHEQRQHVRGWLPLHVHIRVLGSSLWFIFGRDAAKPDLPKRRNARDM